MSNPLIVSACLLGINCVYDGTSNKNKKILELMEKRILIPVCPEQLGGLPTPRDSQDIITGSGEDVLNGNTQVITINNSDVTENFKRGAQEVLEIAIINNVKIAILKENSPSCGVHHVYNLKHGKKSKITGNGVTTALLIKKGIQVFSEKDIEERDLDDLF